MPADACQRTAGILKRRVSPVPDVPAVRSTASEFIASASSGKSLRLIVSRCQPPESKIIRFIRSKICDYPALVLIHRRGVSRDRHERWDRDAMDASDA